MRELLMDRLRREAMPDIVAGENASVIQQRHAKEYSPRSVRDTIARLRSETPGAQGCSQSSSSPPTDQPSESRVREQDTEHITLNATRIHTLEQLVAYCEIDLTRWSILRFIANKWEVGAKDNDGALQVEPLFQVKAWLTRNVLGAAISDEIESMRKKAETHSPIYKRIRRTKRAESKMMAEVSLADMHIGKLAWGRETGWGDYDLKIATELHDTACIELLKGLSVYEFDEMLIVLGNDLLNSDNKIGTTTAGTPQNNDGRYHKAFEAARDAAIRQIERCRLVAPVRVICIPGNHDLISTWALCDSLKSWFRLCADVSFDNEPRTRKYYRFHRLLLGFTHGDRGRPANYPLLMAQEAKEWWGVTAFREVHCGHWHKTKVDDYMGVRVRVLPSLAGEDSWHADSGFVGSIRTSEAFAWNGETGLAGTVLYNVERS